MIKLVKNIAVLGASGFLGSAIVDYCVQEFPTAQIRVLVRAKIDELDPRVEQVIVKEIDIICLAKFLLDSEVVINAIGQLGSWNVDYSDYFSAHIELISNLVAILNKTKPKHFIHLSSASVVGPVADPNAPASESFPFAPQNSYEFTKAVSEVIIQKRLKINWSILRPEFVYGPGDKHVIRLYQAISSGRFVLFNHGNSYLHPTYIDDFLQAVGLTILNKKSFGQTYFVAGSKPLPVKTIAEQISTAFGNGNENWISIPEKFARIIATVMEKVSSFGISPIINHAQIDFFTQHRMFDISKIKSELNYSPKVSYLSGLKKSKKWYEQQGLI